MPRHGFATAVEVVTPDQLRDRVGCAHLTIFVVHTVSFVFIDVELTTPEGVHWRKSTRKWLFLGPALQGRGASSPAQGQVTHTNHTPMNYKYCLVCACQGMASPLQSKLSPQISCATGLGVPIWYTLFKVSAQLVCSWLPNLCTNLKLRVHQLDNICSSHS